MRTTCGFGSVDDREHLRTCIECNRAAWREYRAANPGRLRRWLRRLFEPKGLPVPPDPWGMA